jgi:DNA anti-recombination protein RmuC
MKMAGVTLMTMGWANLATAQGAVTYVGYLFGAGALVLYYRLWTSTSKAELDRLKAALREADTTIERLTALEKTLTKSNMKLHDEHTAMRANFKDMSESYNRLAADFAKLQKEMKEERSIRMEQFAELTKYRVQDPNA